MVDFTLFRLRDDREDPSSLVDTERENLKMIGPISEADFTAWLYVLDSPRRRPPWVSFIEGHIPGAIGWRSSRSASALLLVRTGEEETSKHFAIAFGTTGRHILRGEAFRRRYGLITALNLIVDPEAAPKLRAFDTTRHNQNILRSRVQATSASDLEVFELDLLRDLVQKATGEPADVESWGRRVGGSDSLRIAADIPFSELGEFCLAVDEVARSESYLTQFGWINNITPMTDTELVEELELEIVRLLQDKRTDLLQLAPPEVVDWDELVRFQYHYDTGTRPVLHRQDISLTSYLGGLKEKLLLEVTPRQLRNRKIIGVTAEETTTGEWTVWRCLSAEFSYGDRTYILEDGAFYLVADTYVQQLNHDIERFTHPGNLLPPSKTDMKEPDYNRLAAGSSAGFLLMDSVLVPVEGASKGVELCDVLTTERELIHVKRYGGSATLSHLYFQARTSAELLLTSTDFRNSAQECIGEEAQQDPRFEFFEAERIQPGRFEIVLGIIKQWRGKGIDSLPFFAKMNLRHTALNLDSRGYRVSVLRIPFDPSGDVLDV